MKIPCIKIPIKLAIKLMQQIKSHSKQVENPNGTASVRALLQPNTLSEHCTETELPAAISETLKLLQPVA